MQKYLTSNTAPARQGTVIKKMKPGIQKEPEELMTLPKKPTVKKETISAIGKTAPIKLDQKPSILATSSQQDKPKEIVEIEAQASEIAEQMMNVAKQQAFEQMRQK